MKKINNCPTCKCEMWLPDELCDAALRSSKVGFFCAYGHAQHFTDDCIKYYWGNQALKAKQAKAPLLLALPENSNVVQFPQKSRP